MKLSPIRRHDDDDDDGVTGRGAAAAKKERILCHKILFKNARSADTMTGSYEYLFDCIQECLCSEIKWRKVISR